MKKYFVRDLNTIEEATSFDTALETARYWMELQRPLVEDADDDTLTRWMRSPDMGLESGDVQIFEVEMQEKDLCSIDGKSLIRTLKGKQQIINEFEKRGLTLEDN